MAVHVPIIIYVPTRTIASGAESVQLVVDGFSINRVKGRRAKDLEVLVHTGTGNVQVEF
jgi:hypothetical protein